MKTKRGRLLLLTEDGYVPHADKPAVRLPRRPPARPAQRDIRRAIAFFSPLPAGPKK
jgi:hypothetical protein